MSGRVNDGRSGEEVNHENVPSTLGPVTPRDTTTMNNTGTFLHKGSYDRTARLVTACLLYTSPCNTTTTTTAMPRVLRARAWSLLRLPQGTHVSSPPLLSSPRVKGTSKTFFSRYVYD
ncbi:hypothetical protein E2C01_012655 [Portunus trituberculatus]|uniref:Uncharacterized protein n=1 Tax=Portunus trituberculatus TaxID=210409 RepID=A0A5B7DEG3_PORTR|nr:hypothetical protein [Portunus trituberculatus]